MFLFNLLRDAYFRFATTYQAHSSIFSSKSIFRNPLQSRSEKMNKWDLNKWIDPFTDPESIEWSVHHFGFFFSLAEIFCGCYIQADIISYTQRKSIMKTYFHFIWKKKNASAQTVTMDKNLYQDFNITNAKVWSNTVDGTFLFH